MRGIRSCAALQTLQKCVRVVVVAPPRQAIHVDVAPVDSLEERTEFNSLKRDLRADELLREDDLERPLEL